MHCYLQRGVQCSMQYMRYSIHICSADLYSTNFWCKNIPPLMSSSLLGTFRSSSYFELFCFLSFSCIWVILILRSSSFLGSSFFWSCLLFGGFLYFLSHLQFRVHLYFYGCMPLEKLHLWVSQSVSQWVTKVWSSTISLAPYGPVWPCMVPYFPVWSCLVQYGPL